MKNSCKTSSVFEHEIHLFLEIFQASVFSDVAPIQIKADWAFRVFGNS